MIEWPDIPDFVGVHEYGHHFGLEHGSLTAEYIMANGSQGYFPRNQLKLEEVSTYDKGPVPTE